GPESALVLPQMFERPINRTQAESHPRVRNNVEEILARRMPFRDNDLIENELEVGANQMDAGGKHSAAVRRYWRGRRYWRHNVYNRSGRGRIDLLQHAIGVLVDGPGADRTPRDSPGSKEGV